MWTNPINKPNPHLPPPPTPTPTQRLEYVADATRNPLYRATEAVDPIFQESPLEVRPMEPVPGVRRPRPTLHPRLLTARALVVCVCVCVCVFVHKGGEGDGDRAMRGGHTFMKGEEREHT